MESLIEDLKHAIRYHAEGETLHLSAAQRAEDEQQRAIHMECVEYHRARQLDLERDLIAAYVAQLNRACTDHDRSPLDR